MPLPAGATIAGFRVIRLLGEGGMGAVYLVEHPALPRRDVLKVLHSRMAGDDSFRTRFEHEANLAARLDHPNIVQVYDRGVEGDLVWIRMQYVEGTDAAHTVADGPLDPHRVLHIVRSVGSALDYAHRGGLLHRDVKPANILLSSAGDPDDPERVMLTDFGIAKVLEGDARITTTGQAFFSPAYCAPERFGGGPVDHRVDIYSLGCVTYELLTGELPYRADSVLALIAAHDHRPVPDPRLIRPELPYGVSDVIRRAMAKSVGDRYPSCRALSRHLQAAIEGPRPAPIGAPHVRAPAPPIGTGAVRFDPSTNQQSQPVGSQGFPGAPARPPGGSAGVPPAGRASSPVRTARSSRSRRLWPLLVTGLILSVLLTVVGVRLWALDHWFVGVQDTGSTEVVAVYRGVDAAVLGIELFELDHGTDVAVDELYPAARNRVRGGITATDEEDANRILDNLRDLRLPPCESVSDTAPDTESAAPSSTSGQVSGQDCREVK